VLIAIAAVWPRFESPVFGITGETVLSEIQKRYDGTADLEASFVQNMSEKW
jgi:hypothetical protein